MGWNCVTFYKYSWVIESVNESGPLMTSESLSPDRVFHQVWPLQQWHSALHGAHSSEWPSRRYDSGATGWTVSTNTRRQTDGLKVTGIHFRGFVWLMCFTRSESTGVFLTPEIIRAEFPLPENVPSTPRQLKDDSFKDDNRYTVHTHTHCRTRSIMHLCFH